MLEQSFQDQPTIIFTSTRKGCELLGVAGEERRGADVWVWFPCRRAAGRAGHRLRVAAQSEKPGEAHGRARSSPRINLA